MNELERNDSADGSDSQSSDVAKIDRKFTVQLTENEAFYIYDRITLVEFTDSNGEPVDVGMVPPMKLGGRDRKAGIPASEKIVRKFALCLLSFRDAGTQYIEVEFKKTELLAMRELAVSEAERNGEKVGKNLTLKIARALYGEDYMELVNSERLLQQVYPSGLPVSDSYSLKEEDKVERSKIIFGKPWEEDTALVFASANRLAVMGEIHKAMRNCSSWGEFRSMVSAEVYQEAVECNGDDDEPVDTDVLSIGAYDDCDWPGFLEQEMLDWIPQEVKRIGTVKTSIINGDFLYLDEVNIVEILEILKRHGYECVRDDNALRVAMGI